MCERSTQLNYVPYRLQLFTSHLLYLHNLDVGRVTEIVSTIQSSRYRYRIKPKIQEFKLLPKCQCQYLNLGTFKAQCPSCPGGHSSSVSGHTSFHMPWWKLPCSVLLAWNLWGAWWGFRLALLFLLYLRLFRENTCWSAPRGFSTGVLWPMCRL